MQLGNLVVGCVVGVLVRALRVISASLSPSSSRRIVKLVVERIVRREMAAPTSPCGSVPGTSEPGAILRGKDVPAPG